MLHLFRDKMFYVGKYFQRNHFSEKKKKKKKKKEDFPNNIFDNWLIQNERRGKIAGDF
jgi:hypothetical protein